MPPNRVWSKTSSHNNKIILHPNQLSLCACWGLTVEKKYYREEEGSWGVGEKSQITWMKGESKILPTDIMQRLYKGRKSMGSFKGTNFLFLFSACPPVETCGLTLVRTPCWLLSRTSLFTTVIFYISLSKISWTIIRPTLGINVPLLAI